MNVGGPEHDPEPEQPATRRQKATAAVSQLHPPEMLAKVYTGACCHWRAVNIIQLGKLELQYYSVSCNIIAFQTF
jgi:hypothetical protein